MYHVNFLFFFLSRLLSRDHRERSRLSPLLNFLEGIRNVLSLQPIFFLTVINFKKKKIILHFKSYSSFYFKCISKGRFRIWAYYFKILCTNRYLFGKQNSFETPKLTIPGNFIFFDFLDIYKKYMKQLTKIFFKPFYF